jgi:deoxyribonuclease V
MLRGKHDPSWSSLVDQWKQTQNRMREQMIVRPLEPLPRYVAGADAAFSDDKQTVFAAAVVYDREARQILEVTHATTPAEVPYVPGFLSFSEGSAVLAALGKLTCRFGAILFDGQGYAHPRRCGLATHMAITLGMPGVGVAKSRFIGTYDEPAIEAGSASPLMDKEEQIGLVLRTQHGVRPLFVSVGHCVDLASARELVLACCTKYRIPEPTRQADIEVAKLKRQAASGTSIRF